MVNVPPFDPSKSALNAVQTKGAIGLLFLQSILVECIIPNLYSGDSVK
jgi:hypothetical protein